MKIQPIVEGHGEVKAVPVLLRRLGEEAGAYGIGINSPIRRKRSELTLESKLSRSIELARKTDVNAAILILIDADDDCPRDLGPRLQNAAQTVAREISCQVVLASREYEAWFLGAIESLRGVRGICDDACSHPEPERPRNAKGAIEERLREGNSYAETTDQAAMTARFDFGAAYRSCRSFRKLTKSFGELLSALGHPVEEWPPRRWLSA